jgi:hypothetical protein
MKTSALRGPILVLNMDQLVAGSDFYGHNFQDMINDLTDKLNDVAEYHVRNLDGNFAVYYLTFDDIDAES